LQKEKDDIIEKLTDFNLGKGAFFQHGEGGREDGEEGEGEDERCFVFGQYNYVYYPSTRWFLIDNTTVLQACGDTSKLTFIFLPCCLRLTVNSMGRGIEGIKGEQHAGYRESA